MNFDKYDSDDFHRFNPENENHQLLLKTVHDFLQEKRRRKDITRMKESRVAREVRPILMDKDIDWSKKHIRSLLKEGRVVMEEEEVIKVVKEAKGGIPTNYYQII